MKRILVVAAIMSVVCGSTPALAQLLPHFNPGDVLHAIDLNAIVNQVNTLSGTGPIHFFPVDCGAGGKISPALAQAQPGDVLQLKGTCNETVLITKDDITLDGGGTTIIDGGGGTQPVITIDGARRVLLKGLTVQKGLTGIQARRGAAVLLQKVTAADNTQHGIEAREVSTARLTDCTALRNGLDGLRPVYSSSLQMLGTIISNDNGRDGIHITAESSGTTFGGVQLTATGNANAGLNVLLTSHFVNGATDVLTMQGNKVSGVVVGSQSSFLLAAGSSLTVNGTGVAGSFSAGLNVVENAMFLMQTGSTPAVLAVQDNTGVGLAADRNGALDLRGTVTVQNNASNGLQMFRNARVLLAGFGGAFTAHIDNNGGHGVQLDEASTMTITGGGTLTIQQNKGRGISMDGASSLFVNNVTATIQNNTGRGLFADDSSVSVSNTTISGNGTPDVALSFGTRATLNGNTIGTITCDGTVLSRGSRVCP